MISRFIHREQPSAFDLHLRSHHLVTNNTVYILAGNIQLNNISNLIFNFLEGCLMSNKERELVAAITTERQQRPRGKTGQKNSDRALSKKQRPMKSKDPCSETINLGGGFGKAGDLVNINLDEALPPADEILGNEKVNNQLESDQFGFEGRHYPLSDPLKYNEPKLPVASGVQCNRCQRAFKTFTNLKQHMARSHKVDSSTSKEERSSVIKNEKERQSSLHNIPAHLVTEDLQREIIVR